MEKESSKSHLIYPENVVEASSLDRGAIVKKLAPIYAALPKPSYSIPMAWRCATSMSNDLVDHVPRYSSADHGTIFKCLLAVVQRMLEDGASNFTGPHFDLSTELDDMVMSALQGEYEQLVRLNIEISLQEDYWRLYYDADADAFRLSLAPPQRRSALVLLDHKAEFLATPPEVQEILRGDTSSVSRTIPLVFATGMREVVFLRDAVPDKWQRLADNIGFTIDEAIGFQGFVQTLIGTGRLWFRSEDVLETYKEFAEEHTVKPVNDETIHRLLEFYSATPQEIQAWGIAIPFVQFGEWFAFWPFVHHVLPPSLTFLSLLMRKKSDDWNNTVGSTLAKVANTIRDSLPKKSGLLFVTTKVKAGIGDIDLGIYDSGSRVLMLCEIKTVFDRFRTNYQQSNFTGQRVNFAKAAAQLSASVDAVATGEWKLSQIFGQKLDGLPVRILPVVLTWYDQHNPWLGTDNDDIQSCNFRVFEHLFTQANGDLVMVQEAITQLSRIYCPAVRLPWHVPYAGEGVAIQRDVQSDLLPPKETLDKFVLSDLVRRELETLPKLPIDWKEQLQAAGQSQGDWNIYSYDEH